MDPPDSLLPPDKFGRHGSHCPWQLEGRHPVCPSSRDTVNTGGSHVPTHQIFTTLQMDLARQGQRLLSPGTGSDFNSALLRDKRHSSMGPRGARCSPLCTAQRVR